MFAEEEFLKLIGDHLASILLRDLNTSMDFTYLQTRVQIMEIKTN